MIGKQGMNYSRGSQDWQVEAYEQQGRHNSIIRHQRIIDEMEHYSNPTWGINMSRRKNNEA